MGPRIWNGNTAKMYPGHTKNWPICQLAFIFILLVYVTFNYSQLVLQVMANGSGERKRPAEESNGDASAKKPR